MSNHSVLNSLRMRRLGTISVSINHLCQYTLQCYRAV